MTQFEILIVVLYCLGALPTAMIYAAFGGGGLFDGGGDDPSMPAVIMVGAVWPLVVAAMILGCVFGAIAYFFER